MRPTRERRASLCDAFETALSPGGGCRSRPLPCGPWRNITETSRGWCRSPMGGTRFAASSARRARTCRRRLGSGCPFRVGSRPSRFTGTTGTARPNVGVVSYVLVFGILAVILIVGGIATYQVDATTFKRSSISSSHRVSRSLLTPGPSRPFSSSRRSMARTISSRWRFCQRLSASPPRW
jgi:hypothetical protein